MRLSKKFLSKFVDVSDIDYKELADKLTKAGSEYSSITKISNATGVIVGYVEDCIMHPDSDHLHVCKVKINENDVTQIVCGAPNVSKGQKVIVALPGAVLSEDFVIKESTIRGQVSNGMLCSLKEIGLDEKYQSEEDKKGIHILNEDAPIGVDAICYLGYDDEVIEFDLTSNKADLLSVMGFAYEVGALLNKKVNTLEVSYLETNDIKDYLNLEVQTDNCSLYSAKLVKNVTIKESPLWLKNILMAHGIRSINNVVDISNYVMLETGQPLHFFDYDKLGENIVVRQALDNETMITLDKKERVLNSNDIVITDGVNPVALAGVMGNFETEVTVDTKNIVIESAIFNSYNVRLTSKKIIRSEASNRYEKGIDPNRSILAIKRSCHLLEKLADATVVGNILQYDKTNKVDKVISITVLKINKVLGLNLTADEIISIFNRLGFVVENDNDNLKVYVPTRRLDLNIEEDLIEEVGRINGIENIISVLPKTEGSVGGVSQVYKLEKLIRDRLLGLGLSEVKTYSLTSEYLSKQFILDEINFVKVLSPLSDDKSVFRYSLIPSLIDVYNYNASRKQKDIMIQEISNVYKLDLEKVIEEKRLAGLISGNVIVNPWNKVTVKSDFYYLKGIVENLLNYLGYNKRINIEIGDIPNEFHPYQSAVIKIDREIIGYLGCVNPSISKIPLYVFEINLTKLFNIKVRQIKNKEISKYPSITKDLAFIVNESITSKEIIEVITKTGGKLLSDVNIFDLYRGENIENDKKSLAFSLTFMDNFRTLTEEEVMNLLSKIIISVTDRFNAVLRDK